MTIRYALAALLFALALLYFIGGYAHARRRLSRNLPPLRYHRWMVTSSRRYRGQHPVNSAAYMQRYQSPFQHQQQQQGYGQGEGMGAGGYMMNEYAPPPPAYHSSEVPPPVYQPPEGASKVLADQRGFERVDLGTTAGGGAAVGAAGRS